MSKLATAIGLILSQPPVAGQAPVYNGQKWLPVSIYSKTDVDGLLADLVFESGGYTISQVDDLLAAKQNVITLGSTAQYLRGDLSLATLNSSAVGLGNVLNAVQLVAGNNLSDLTNTTTARANLGVDVLLATKAAIISPALSGSPTAPTATAGTNTTQLATTAFVRSEITALINLAPGALDTLGEIASQITTDQSVASALATTVASKQPLDGTLTALAGLSTAADKLPYFTGNDTGAVADLSAFARTILDDASAGAVRTTLGLGTAALAASGDFAPVSHSHSVGQIGTGTPAAGTYVDGGTGAWTALPESGGGGTPGGSDTYVQFNDGGTLGGDAGLTYNKTTDALTVVGPVTGYNFQVAPGPGGGLQGMFRGYDAYFEEVGNANGLIIRSLGAGLILNHYRAVALFHTRSDLGVIIGSPLSAGIAGTGGIELAKNTYVYGTLTTTGAIAGTAGTFTGNVTVGNAANNAVTHGLEVSGKLSMVDYSPIWFGNGSYGVGYHTNSIALWAQQGVPVELGQANGSVLTPTFRVKNGRTTTWSAAAGAIVTDDGTTDFQTGTIRATGTVTATAFVGDGSGLTGIGGGGGGTPGGSDTQVQFNDGGGFGGDSGLTFNKTTNILTVTGNVAAANFQTTGVGNNSVQIGESATVGQYGTVIGVGASGGVVGTAVGAGSNAAGSWSNAYGVFAASAGANAIAIGGEAVASGAEAIAMGRGVTATANQTIIGKPTNRLLQGGVTDDGTTIHQGTTARFTGLVTASNLIESGTNLQVGTGTTMGPGNSVAVGQGALAFGGVAVGKNAGAHYGCVAIGQFTSAYSNAGNSTVIGNSASDTTNGENGGNAVVIGKSAYAAGHQYVVLLGKDTVASGTYAIAIGHGVTAGASQTVLGPATNRTLLGGVTDDTVTGLQGTTARFTGTIKALVCAISALPAAGTIGRQAFVTDTNRPVWDTGAAWVYADGSAV